MQPPKKNYWVVKCMALEDKTCAKLVWHGCGPLRQQEVGANLRNISHAKKIMLEVVSVICFLLLNVASCVTAPDICMDEA